MIVDILSINWRDPDAELPEEDVDLVLWMKFPIHVYAKLDGKHVFRDGIRSARYKNGFDTFSDDNGGLRVYRTLNSDWVKGWIYQEELIPCEKCGQAKRNSDRGHVCLV